MSRKRGRKKRRKNAVSNGGSVAVAGDRPCSFDEAEALVRELITRGQHRRALNEAKAVHKRHGTQLSEDLLVETYIAKMESFPHSMVTEAKALHDLVRSRFPTAGGKLRELEPVLAARGGRFDELLEPLASSSLSPEMRRRIEAVIRTEARDLEALAKCSVLPEDHPVNRAAASAWAAFSAATSGPTRNDALALSGISRRSPVSPWKPLIRAIGCFYRGEDDACLKLAAAVDADTAPAPLARLLSAAVTGGTSPSASLDALSKRIGARPSDFRSALEAMDVALAAGEDRSALRAGKRALRSCHELAPDLVDSLKQRLFIACFLNLKEMPPGKVRAALGGYVLHDARFWRLFARALEIDGDVVLACASWEEFRRNAIGEAWFATGSPEEGAVYSRMARAMALLPPRDRAHAREHFPRVFPGFGELYEGQPQRVRAQAPGAPDFYYLDVETLYERACACDPHAENFQRWLQWAKTEQGWKSAETAALAWTSARPDDTAPLLHLVASCEARGSVKKALRFLAQAERLDGVNPDVKRARLRLVAANAVRHLRDQKVHLADKDIADLSKLPDAQLGDRPALLPALDWIQVRIHGIDEEEEEESFERTARLLGSAAAATAFLSGLSQLVRLPLPPMMAFANPPKAGAVAGDLAKAVARSAALGADFGLSIPIPPWWIPQVEEDLARGATRLEASELRILAEAALRQEEPELAYQASRHGLSRGEPHTARFLLLRAQSLPAWDDRVGDCLVAARELARQHRDMELLGEIVEAGRRGVTVGDELVSSVDREVVAGIVQSEVDQIEYPGWSEPPAEIEACQCPACRRERRLQPESHQYELFGDPLDDEEEDFDPDPTGVEGIPPEVLDLFLELQAKHEKPEGKLPDLKNVAQKDPELVDRLLSAFLESGLVTPEELQAPKKRSKRKRKRRR